VTGDARPDTTVTVVIPTYNRARCVGRAIMSVLEQSAPPHEVLVIDDGSSDDTKAVVGAITDARVRYVLKDNAGVSSARNLGVALASGQWVAFLDSDDTWRPTKLERQLQCLELTGAEVCFTGAASEDGEREDGIAALAPDLPADACRGYPTPVEFITRSTDHPLVQTLLIRRELLQQVGGFDETLVVAEDTALFYELVSGHDVALVNTALVDLTRERDDAGLSDATDVRAAAARFDCYIRVQAKALGHISARRASPAESAEAIRVVRRRLAYFLSRRSEIAHASGDHVLGRRLALEALSLAGDARTTARSLVLAHGHRRLLPRLTGRWTSS
jgi:glycosyltransferase involved in cell wall biosynthesis